MAKLGKLADVLQQAYGLTFGGLPRVEELVLVQGPSPTAIEVRTDTSPDRPELRPVDAEGGVRQLSDGRLLALDRARRTAVLHGPPLSPDLIAHPYLGAVATVFSRWEGREAFHAGAFVRGGRAWAVSGPRTAGKSTFLAALAARGTPVLSDDVLVTDGTTAFRGPRCVDLREAPPFAGLELHAARRGERLRTPLPPAPPEVPLGGWFFLAWGPACTLERLAPAVALGVLARRRSAALLESDPAALLALGTLPAWRLSRPRRFDAVEETLALVDRTIETVVATPPAPLVHR